MMTRQMTKRMPRDTYRFCFICLCGMIGTQYDSSVTTQLKVVDIVNCFLFFSVFVSDCDFSDKI